MDKHHSSPVLPRSSLVLPRSSLVLPRSSPAESLGVRLVDDLSFNPLSELTLSSHTVLCKQLKPFKELHERE